MRKFSFSLIIFFLFTSILFSKISVTLKLYPQKSSYNVDENLTLYFSCKANNSHIKGDIYIVFLTPSNQFYSITKKGVISGIYPIATGIPVKDIDDIAVFKFKYYSIFQKAQYKILSAIIESDTKNIVSNIYTLFIPTKKSETPEPSPKPSEKQEKWNNLKLLWKNTSFRNIKLANGKNYIHALLNKSYHKCRYLRIDKKGNLIIPPLKLPFGSYEYYSTITADENDNAYLIYSALDKGLYFYKISKDGKLSGNFKFFEFENRYKSRMENFSSVYKNGKIYYVCYLPYLEVADEDDPEFRTYYRNSIAFGIVDKDGHNILSPFPIAGEVTEYYYPPGKPTEINYFTGDIYTKNPFILVDDNNTAHIFWYEKNNTLKTKYFLRYMRYSPGKVSQKLTIAEVGDYPSNISGFIDNNTIYIGFIDKTHLPNTLKIVKLSTDGKLISAPKPIPPDNPSSNFFIYKNLNKNIEVIYLSNGKFYKTEMKDNLVDIVKEKVKLFDTSFGYNYDFCKDNNNFIHLLTYKSSPSRLLYSNTNPDNSSFKNLPDLVLSPASFSCSPSENVKVGQSLNCSFKVYNISENSSISGEVSVKINNKDVYSANFNSISPFSSKSFTFQFTPEGENYPEYPEVEITANSNTTELTTINNTIHPKIHVAPLPEDYSFRIYVYDETYNPNHEYWLPKVKNPSCSIYNKDTGEFVADALLNQFKNIPVGKNYIIKCNKTGYNEAEKEISIERDSNDPYKINLKVDGKTKHAVKIYMNKWGSLQLTFNYVDNQNNTKPLTGVNITIANDKFKRIYNNSSSSKYIDKIPPGTYVLTVERENYKRVKITDLKISTGKITEKEITTYPTTEGEVKIVISSQDGIIPSKATLKFEKNGSVVKTVTVTNGEYNGSFEKGYYKLTVTSQNYNSETENFSVKAGLLKTINITLTPKTPSNLKSYTRGEEIGVVTYPVVAEWPSSPVTDGFTVSTLYGVFNIETDFIGNKKDNKIYNLKQMKIKLSGKGAVYYSVESSWDPTDLIDLPETVELAKNVCDYIEPVSSSGICRFPLALWPEITINLGGYTGKTMVRVDKIIVKDDKGITLFETSNSIYSDNVSIFNINKNISDDTEYIKAEVYMKVGELDNTTGEFQDLDVLDGWNAQYIKITYKVPVVEPEYGYYYCNVVSGNCTHLVSSDFGQSILPSNMFILKYKPYKPYTVIMQYVNENYYKTNILGIQEE